MSGFVLSAYGPSRRGLVAAIADEAAGLTCDIIDCAQFVDTDSQTFFLRMFLENEGGQNAASLAAALQKRAATVGLSAELSDMSQKMRVVIMVSRFGHCLNDLLYRARIGALPIDIVGVISNHTEYQGAVRAQGLSFHHIPVSPETKVDAERRQMEVIAETRADLVVLARYMQVLSTEMCHKMSGRIINIHHSFLPSFKGAVPYRQAFEKGVKLIGATAHYVTEDLDEGPIIEQDVIRVSHAQSAGDFVALGRDVEAMVLSRAIHAHTTHRVFRSASRTVVFPASPGSFSSERPG